MPALTRSRFAVFGVLVAGGLIATACTVDPTPVPTPEPVALTAAATDAFSGPVVVDIADPVSASVRVSEELYSAADLVVLAAPEQADLATAASLAVAAGVPLLRDGPTGDDDPVADELERLGVTHVLTVGDVRELPELTVTPVDGVQTTDELDAAGVELAEPQTVPADGLVDAVAALARPDTPMLTLTAEDATEPTGTDDTVHTGRPTPGDAPWQVTAAEPRSDRTALLIDPAADDDPTSLLAPLATARAADLPVVRVPGGDPRVTTDTVGALTDATGAIALGDSFGSADRLAPRLASAATGQQLPGGGQLVFPRQEGIPGKRYIALYGTPGTPALGVLGEQDVPATIARAQQTADAYRALTGDTVVPTLEIIATIASAGPEADNSYSRPRSVDELRPLIEAAADADMAVVIDLQPGRTDFLTQAKQYAELLEYPHVGLALDPEWRLKPDQVHLRQIGSVSVDEVNQVSDWLAGFVRERQLPQKMFLLHQFSLRMITNRERLNVDHDELATIIHADGQGTQPAKTDTWNALHQGAPAVHWGWKNFYDEDQPMLTPEQTYQVVPVPDLVTYQ
ncbi:hypothetical protein [Cellulomonas sp. NPDC089187]|uniref:hypothetical protein n=1 Tax=Cellulomonas sp. NPDC089187 TaxID=3154970 RepID=UPI00343EA82A